MEKCFGRRFKRNAGCGLLGMLNSYRNNYIVDFGFRGKRCRGLWDIG